MLLLYAICLVIAMQYRDKNEIIAQILESANGNRIRLTKIMYDVYLSHAMTRDYLVLLIKKGLIEYQDGERTFKTTEKGLNFLRIHNSLQELRPFTTKVRSREGRISFL
jgi:predicted transcriptional regulator